MLIAFGGWLPPVAGSIFQRGRSTDGAASIGPDSARTRAAYGRPLAGFD